MSRTGTSGGTPQGSGGRASSEAAEEMTNPYYQRGSRSLSQEEAPSSPPRRGGGTVSRMQAARSVDCENGVAPMEIGPASDLASEEGEAGAPPGGGASQQQYPPPLLSRFGAGLYAAALYLCSVAAACAVFVAGADGVAAATGSPQQIGGEALWTRLVVFAPPEARVFFASLAAALAAFFCEASARKTRPKLLGVAFALFAAAAGVLGAGGCESFEHIAEGVGGTEPD